MNNQDRNQPHDANHHEAGIRRIDLWWLDEEDDDAASDAGVNGDEPRLNTSAIVAKENCPKKKKLPKRRYIPKELIMPRGEDIQPLANLPPPPNDQTDACDQLFAMLPDRRLEHHESQPHQKRVVEILIQYPNLARKGFPIRFGGSGFFGRYPLFHILAAKGVTLETIQAIYELHPEAESQRLPPFVPSIVHYAIWVGARLDIIEFLVQECPSALTLICEHGGLPIHHAFFHQALPVSTLEALMAGHPKGLQGGSLWSNEIIEHALNWSKNPVAVLKILLEGGAKTETETLTIRGATSGFFEQPVENMQECFALIMMQHNPTIRNLLIMDNKFDGVWKEAIRVSRDSKCGVLELPFRESKQPLEYALGIASVLPSGETWHLKFDLPDDQADDIDWTLGAWSEFSVEKLSLVSFYAGHSLLRCLKEVAKMPLLKDLDLRFQCYHEPKEGWPNATNLVTRLLQKRKLRSLSLFGVAIDMVPLCEAVKSWDESGGPASSLRKVQLSGRTMDEKDEIALASAMAEIYTLEEVISDSFSSARRKSHWDTINYYATLNRFGRGRMLPGPTKQSLDEFVVRLAAVGPNYTTRSKEDIRYHVLRFAPDFWANISTNNGI